MLVRSFELEVVVRSKESKPLTESYLGGGCVWVGRKTRLVE